MAAPAPLCTPTRVALFMASICVLLLFLSNYELSTQSLPHTAELLSLTRRYTAERALLTRNHTAELSSLTRHYTAEHALLTRNHTAELLSLTRRLLSATCHLHRPCVLGWVAAKRTFSKEWYTLYVTLSYHAP